MTPATAHRPPDKLRVLSTLNEDGSRRWIRPRVSSGRFLARRRAVAYFLIFLFTAIPYLKLNGKPLILLDLTTRHFTFFGRTFLPTDTLLLALLFVGCFVTIFLLTALFGRVWCGWGCPQTVYMEFVFRPIERLFEGSPGHPKKGPLAGKPWSKPLKVAVFVLISMYLAHTFLAYFVGVENLRHWITSSPLRHPTPFLVMLVVTGLMLFDFGFFREQVCIIVCPYGRFQSALLDRNSLIVSYDRVRGEPRGKTARPGGDVSLNIVEASPAKRSGDCVDCGLCVTTCPTGIDIREGLQMECISCTQCIDACDAVMTKLKRPRGLIRYGSQSGMAGEPRRLFRPRVIIYPAILMVIVTAFLIVLATKGPADITILRGVGRPFVELPGGDLGNPVKIKIVNRTDAPEDYRIELSGADGLHLAVEENPVHLLAGQSRVLPAMIAAPASFSEREDPAILITVTAATHSTSTPAYSKSVRFRFMGPGHHASSHESDKPKQNEEH